MGGNGGGSGEGDGPLRVGTPTEAFDALRDERRVRVLEVLAARRRKHPEDPTLGFAELRKRAGVPDSGNFNYHLGKLRDRFVVEAEGGYRLTPAGVKVVSAVVSGAYAEHDPREERLDEPCPACGATLRATVERGLLTLACAGDHRFRNVVPPSLLDAPADELVARLVTATRNDFELVREGACPFCEGPLSVSWAGPGEDAHLFTGRCPRCSAGVELPAGAVATSHPAAVSFCHERGVDLREDPYLTLRYWTGDPVSVASRDPVRLDVSVSLPEAAPGDELVLGVDDAPSVVAVQPGED
ncbi:MAG: winged helix-turn-helix domain-containing protein [Haloferacaceae archaeon]